MKKLLCVILATALLVCLFAGCSGPAATLSIDKRAMNLKAEGETSKITPTLENSDEALVWTSANEDVATVDENGLVTAVGNGSCKVTVTAGELSASCNVVCKWAQSVDLTAFYSDLTSRYELGSLMELTDDLLDSYYPGLNDYSLKQKLAYMPAMTSVVSEYVFVECEKAEDVEAVTKLLQKRVDDQAAGGAWYPDSVEAWGKAQVVSSGNYVAMIASAENTDAIASDFLALFA